MPSKCVLAAMPSKPRDGVDGNWTVEIMVSDPLLERCFLTNVEANLQAQIDVFSTPYWGDIS